MPNLSFINKNNYNVIGVMSGTSLDGLDICFCTISKNNSKWFYEITKSITIDYTHEMKAKLSSAFSASGVDLTKLDYEFGHWIGKEVKQFIGNSNIIADFIASHGHTIHHQPNNGFTLQIGKGSAIAAETGLPCICDFRSSDVCHGGQGAPLVPIGDKYLFSEFDICLNLGGFANLSFENNNSRMAFDIGPCNIILNLIAQELGYSFDLNGDLGRNGTVNEFLLSELNSLDFYGLVPPKSLGREWVENTLKPIIKNIDIPLNDKLGTLYEHIAVQICNTTNRLKGNTILTTGGGAHNSFLIHLIQNKSNKSIVIPDKQTINYKEALIFAFLGVLFISNHPGALSSVTGANKDCLSGCLYF